MNFSQGQELKVDLDLQKFFEAESQVSRFNLLVHALNDKCWDLCMHKVSTRLEPKVEGCLVNCVNRFLDATNFIFNRFEKTQTVSSNTEFMSLD